MIKDLYFPSNMKVSPYGFEEDFIEYGVDIISSEELTNTFYQVFLDLMPERWNGDVNLHDIALFYQIPPYIPCVKRIALTGEIDIESDQLPGIRTIGYVYGSPQTGKAEAEFFAVRPIHVLPRGYSMPSRTIQKYKKVSMSKSGKALECIVSYFGIKENGHVVMALEPDMKHYCDTAIGIAGTRFFSAAVCNIWADKRYQWLVRAKEDLGRLKDIKVDFGVNKEHVKSLFYARSLPLTETGRKRPILHWVRAHNRRIKEGIDIDIKSHLRGIHKFEMHGLNLEITQPNKAVMKQAEPTQLKKAVELYG